MANNFPGPYQLDIHYTVAGLEHVQKLNFKANGTPSPGTPFDDIEFLGKDFTIFTSSAALNGWVALLQPLFSAGTTLDYAEIWSVAPLSNDRTFIASKVIGSVGTSGGDYTPCHQLTLTNRTVEGGILRIVLMESTNTSQVRTPYAGVGAVVQAIFDYVNDASTWVLGRDTSYPISPLNQVGGQNEALFRRRNR